jgi:hypothetical protein
MSRLRSARGGSSSRSAAVRTPGRPGVFVQTPQSDIFVAMLGIALGAIVLGMLLLVLVLKRYDFSTKAATLLPAHETAVAFAGGPAPEIFSTVHL